MREGINPAYVDSGLPQFGRHRVLMPVHIPHHQGYYAQAVEILRLCLDSLWRTTQGRASISVISNGSTAEVAALLTRYFESGQLDQLVLNESNWGKVDSALTAVHGRFEPLITIADADVLFLPGWLDAVEEVFWAFPEAGFVTPAPNPALAFVHTTTTLLAAALKRELSWKAVVPEPDLDQFAHSIGRPDYYRPEHRRSQMIVSRGKVTACVGGGHFVFTVRREVAGAMPHLPTRMAMGNALSDCFDEPPDRIGTWRLSTTKAFVRHMGNVPEPWMYQEEGETIPAGSGTDGPLPPLQRSLLRTIPLSWRQRGVAVGRRLGRRVRASRTVADQARAR